MKILLSVMLSLPAGMTWAAVLQGKLEFPNSSCSSHPPNVDRAISCVSLGRVDGMPTYKLVYGRSARPLVEFSRSATVIYGNKGDQIAINIYEGSNSTECSAIFDVNNPDRKVSVSKLWLKALSSRAKILQQIISADHTYYTCEKFEDGKLNAVVRWDRSPGSYSKLSGIISPDGKISNITYDERPN